VVQSPNVIIPSFIAGFSGHRDIVAHKVIADALDAVWQQLQQQAKQRGGALEVYSSIAYGADTIAVETARAAGLRVHLILPKPIITVAGETIDTQAGFAADFWDNDPQESGFRSRDWDRAYVQIREA